MMRIEMHPVANEVEVPIEEIERQLLKRAVPGFTGSLAIHIRVSQEAAGAVVFTPEERDVQGSKGSKAPPTLSPPWEPGVYPTERENEVRVKMAQNKYRFRLGMKLTTVVGHFKDGHLGTVDFVGVG